MTNPKGRSLAWGKTGIYCDKTIIRLIGKPKIYFCVHIYRHWTLSRNSKWNPYSLKLFIYILLTLR